MEADGYKTLEAFVLDVNKIFYNCKLYNEDGTTYTKCAAKLSKFFVERFEALRLEFGIPMSSHVLKQKEPVKVKVEPVFE